MNRRPGPAGLDHGRRVSSLCTVLPSRAANRQLAGAAHTALYPSPPTRCRSDRDETPPPSTASSRPWGVGWLTRSASARGGAILRLQLSAGVACRPPAVRGLDAGVRSRHVDFLAEALARPARPYEFLSPGSGPGDLRTSPPGRPGRVLAVWGVVVVVSLGLIGDAAGLGADLGLEPDQPPGVRRGAGAHRRAAARTRTPVDEVIVVRSERARRLRSRLRGARACAGRAASVAAAA